MASASPSIFLRTLVSTAQIVNNLARIGKGKRRNGLGSRNHVINVSYGLD